MAWWPRRSLQQAKTSVVRAEWRPESFPTVSRSPQEERVVQWLMSNNTYEHSVELRDEQCRANKGPSSWIRTPAAMLLLGVPAVEVALWYPLATPTSSIDWCR